MIFDLSYNKAMLIQRAQLAYYRQHLGRSGTLEIRKRTKPCPPDVHPDTLISIFLINKLVPRGGDIENIIMKRYKKNKNVCIDQNTIAWHDAIRRGLV